MLNSLKLKPTSSSSVEQSASFLHHPHYYYQNDFWVEGSAAVGGSSATVSHLLGASPAATPIVSVRQQIQQQQLQSMLAAFPGQLTDAVANTFTTSTSSSSTLSPSPSPSSSSAHRNHQHLPSAFYCPTSSRSSAALQQHCSSLILNQIHRRATSTEKSSYETMNRHYQQIEQQQHHATNAFSLSGPNHNDDPFHRLAEAIVATAKPSTHSHNFHHHHHRPQSIIKKNNSSNSGLKLCEVSPTDLLLSKVGGSVSSLNPVSLGGSLLLRNQHRQPFASPSPPSPPVHQSSIIFDRRAKRSLTGAELERKRDLANKQERRRMHRLNDALNRLREVLACLHCLLCQTDSKYHSCVFLSDNSRRGADSTERTVQRQESSPIEDQDTPIGHCIHSIFGENARG